MGPKIVVVENPNYEQLTGPLEALHREEFRLADPSHVEAPATIGGAPGANESAPKTDRERLEAIERLLPAESPFSPGSAAGGSVAEERAIARWHERWGAFSDTIDAAKAKLGPEVGRTRGLPTMPSNPKPPAAPAEEKYVSDEKPTNQKPLRVLTDGGIGNLARKHGIPLEVVSDEEFDRATAAEEEVPAAVPLADKLPVLAWLFALLLLGLPAMAHASPPRCTIWEYLGGECAQPASQLQDRALGASGYSPPFTALAFAGASVDVGGHTRWTIRPLTDVGAGVKVLDLAGHALDALAIGGTTGTTGGLVGGGACFQLSPGAYDYVAAACAALLFPVLAGQPEPPRAALLFAVGPKF